MVISLSWKQRVVSEVDALEGELTRFLVDLVKIPTENPPGINYVEMAELIGKKMSELGYVVEYVEVPPDRFHELVPFSDPRYRRVNVIARSPGAKRRPVLHFNGHVDVVPAGEGWSVPPYAGLVKDGRIYGRGASDMKGGLAAMVYAVEAIRRAGYKLNGTVEYSFVVDEETAGVKNAGTYYLLEQGHINKNELDYVIIPEPTGLDKVCIGSRGVVWWRIKIYGKQAHGATPQLGVNAAHKAADLVHLITHHLAPRLRGKTSNYEVYPEVGREPSISVNVVKCGTKVNLVPEKCILEVDRRVIPEESLSEVREEFSRILGALKKLDPEFNYDLEEIYSVDSVVVPQNQPLVKALEESVRDITGKYPSKVLMAATTDGRFYVKNAGVASTVIYGPGNQLHVADEYVEVKDLLNGAKALALTVARLLGLSI